ncbi:MAG: FGGY-family carbohydrate kinase [Chloroflexota bacterium]|nr:FGGY-family carbohydrate kinase [Chloroflexota bacterium]
MTLLVIDLGSSSVRTLLFDDGARLIEGAVCSRKHDFETDHDGKAEANADHLRALTEACLDDILTHPAAESIAAAGMASFAGNWLGVDANGRARTPVLTYADTRGRSAIAGLRQRLGGALDAYHQATGCFIHPAYFPAQYAYMKEFHSRSLEQVRRISDIGGYLYRHWFGREAPISYSLASWSGLLGTRGLGWHFDFIRQLLGADLLERLPDLADFDACQVGLADAYAGRWTQLRGVPFFLALGDGAVANLGSGAVDARRIALTIGTTSALRVVTRRDRLPDGLWRYLVCQGMPLVGGATSEGGNVYQWGVEELGLDTASLNARLSEARPDQHRLTVLPLIAGERSPGWQSDASGTIHGIRRSTSKLDIMQAQLEAVAIRLSMIFDQLKSEESAVIAGGGALGSSPAWAQMIADAFNAPIQLLDQAEITARGVALLLRNWLDGTALDADPPRISRILRPNPDHALIYQAARARQVDLYQRLYG